MIFALMEIFVLCWLPIVAIALISSIVKTFLEPDDSNTPAPSWRRRFALKRFKPGVDRFTADLTCPEAPYLIDGLQRALARWKPPTGVDAAVAAEQRATIHHFLDALAQDICRINAQEARNSFARALNRIPADAVNLPEEIQHAACRAFLFFPHSLQRRGIDPEDLARLYPPVPGDNLPLTPTAPAEDAPPSGVSAHGMPSLTLPFAQGQKLDPPTPKWANQPVLVALGGLCGFLSGHTDPRLAQLGQDLDGPLQDLQTHLASAPHLTPQLETLLEIAGPRACEALGLFIKLNGAESPELERAHAVLTRLPGLLRGHLEVLRKNDLARLGALVDQIDVIDMTFDAPRTAPQPVPQPTP